MNIFEVEPLKKPVNTTIELPGSKSYTNRALVMSALTKGPVTLYNPLYSEDTEIMIGCLRSMGLKIETFADRVIVYDDISVIQNGFYDLFAKDSGTTIRFLLALICLTPGIKVIRGNTRLNERPIKDLVDTLRLLGAKIDYLEKEGQAPLKISSSTLSLGSEVTIDASMSSQFFSALLMIAPFLNGLKISLRGELISKSYVDMTIHSMLEWGVGVLQREDGSYHIPTGQRYRKDQYKIEGDFSSAGYFFAIAALTQSTINLKNLNPDSAQADRKFLNILQTMGNKINVLEDTITITGEQILPRSLDMEECPDQVQTMAVLAAFAKGITKISGVRSLRLKETERVQALKNELAKMGIKTEDTHDTLTVYGGDPHAAIIDTYGDHRMAMAFAVAGTKLSGIKIRNPDVVNKTFPTFWDKLNSVNKRI
jgi:3-phosphoshikimate 1-carboxyvinyltransferase